jgi:hypothetical protein
VVNPRSAGPTWPNEVDQARRACAEGQDPVAIDVTPGGWFAVVPCSSLPG